MKVESFAEFLTTHAGARKEAHSFVIPSDTDVTIFVGLEGETLAVTKANKVELADAMVIIDTARGERVCVALEDVRAMKMDRSAAERTSRGAGFGK
jgi:hypothetical protein